MIGDSHAATAVFSSLARAGKPQSHFEVADATLTFRTANVQRYDLDADGHRFYVTQVRPFPALRPVTHVRVVEHWFEELKAKVPPAR